VIPEQTIQKVLDAARIEDVINDFVPLKRRGVNMIGNCPFHHEKTPSFTVSPAKGIYKCFGCGASGNASKFVMDIEHVSFPEAIQYLARKYNIPIEEVQMSPEQAKASQARERLFAINAFAQRFFTDMLWNDDEGRSIGLSYFRERHLRDDIIQKFQLGYNPDQERRFTNFAIQNGYELDELKLLGLTQKEREGDFYRGRVIFPIQNLSGKIVAFGARTLKKDKNIAKYFNSPETPIYHKGSGVYGIYQAKNSIVRNNFCYLVEGYMDVISLAQGGVENVVASSGTALTVDQVKLIKRFTNNLMLLYDGDAAGIKAAMRGLEIIVEEGMNLKLVLLPDGEDPDSFMQSRGIDGFTEYVTANAKDFIKFKIQDVMEAAKSDPYRKAEVVREMIALLAKVPDTFVRAEYVREFSNLIEVSEAQVLQEVNKAIRGKLKKETNIPSSDIDQIHAIESPDVSAPPQEVMTAKNEEPQERAIVRSLIEFGALPMSNEKTVEQYIHDEVEIAMFENPLLMQLVQIFMEQYQNGVIPPMSWYTSLTDPALCKMAIDLVQEQHELSPNWESKNIYVTKREQVYEQEVLSVVHYFKLRKVMRMIDNYMAELKDMKSEEEIIVQQSMIKVLFESKRTIAGGKGSVIV